MKREVGNWINLALDT